MLSRLYSLILVIIFFSLFYYFYFRNRCRLRYGIKYLNVTKLEPQNNIIEIPKIIHQTYFSKAKVPQKINQNLRRYAPNHTVYLYDDNDIREFLKLHFDKNVLQMFDSLKMGAHKADLFRYCVLYVKGGIYLDIKTELIQDIDTFFPDGTISTVATTNELIYQGIIASPPRQEIFLTLIDGILRSGIDFPYNLFLRDFMRYLRKDCGVKKIDLRGIKLKGKIHKYKIFHEKITKDHKKCKDGLDRYGLCSFITYDSKEIIKTRYADYPWK